MFQYYYYVFVFLALVLHGYKVNSFASPSIPPPPSLSLPVWSLACPLSPTTVPDNNDNNNSMEKHQTSMNIVTYAMPVSVAPPKLWAVSLYKNTLTRCAFLDCKIGILQLLSPHQSRLVPVLGKRSGLEVGGFSKQTACADLNISWRRYSDCCCSSLLESNNNLSNYNTTLWRTMDILPQCQSYVHLKLLSTLDAGDHDLALCEVLATGVWHHSTNQLSILGQDDMPMEPNDCTSVLYTGQLRREGII